MRKACHSAIGGSTFCLRSKSFGGQAGGKNSTAYSADLPSPAIAGYAKAGVKPLATKAGFCILNSTFSSAFSLIELIVVMLIVSILVTVVIIKFTGVDYQNNRVAASELRSHLTYIRNMAMNRERAMKVQFSVVSNRYDVYMATNNWSDGYLPAKDPVTQKDWTVDLSSKFSGVALQNVTINGNNTNLYFSETNGTPFCINGTNWVLLTNGVITFSSGLKVTVAPVTGYADIIE